MDPYRQFIAKSRYARYLDSEQRRENWQETVARYVDNVLAPKIKNTAILDELHNAIEQQDILPSMRGLMTAGPALNRDHTCLYNCSYLPVDDVRAFDEAMYILLCGTGVGFSVESKYVHKLPEVPSELETNGSLIVVNDSKEGWARALRLLLSHLFSGEIPKYDVSKVRPKGARLKTFGGRASGPGPLVELFEFTIDMFRHAKGRKLYTIEAHDLMCKIGEVVVVGGVRRSAMISLSDLHDERMRNAKAGDWHKTHPHRGLANNSAVYESDPSMGEFMSEWVSIYKSYSGERGIFNRQASQNQAAKNGRRVHDIDFGTNPCSEIILRPYQFCNLSTVVIRADDTAESVKRKVRLAAILGTVQATYTKFPYLRKIWQKNTEAEALLGVSLCGLYDNYALTNDATTLEMWKDEVIAANKEWAEELGINPSTATTCVKPEGTVSQLTDAASGIHPRHARHYIRRVRADIKDPLSDFMVSAGVPHETCVYRPNDTLVFEFPIAAPKTVTRDEVSSIDHLEFWLKVQRHWCEHKPSVTINIQEDDWLKVGAWTWDHFNEVTGVSFLPYDGGSYRQAPYEEINAQEFAKLKDAMPAFNFDDFIELDDNVEGVQTLACTAGQCEINF